MPRDGSGVYTAPFPPVVAGTTIESAVYNGFVSDVATDLNAARPIVAGGTGASSVDGALDNLSAEKYKQVVTNWDSNVWRAGSFYAATTATGTAPVAGHAFAGIVYYANATDFVIEATDLTDPLRPVEYKRVMASGVWSNWSSPGSTFAAKANYIINGAMMVSQENGSAVGSTLNYYPVDQFFLGLNSTTGVISAQQVSLPTPGGSPTRLRFAVVTQDASVGGSDAVIISTRLEGLNVANLKLGTSGAKTVTLQFGVRSVAGTYCVALRNGVPNRSYVAEYTIAAGEAGADVVKSVTIQLDTTGSWSIDNNLGLDVIWTLMAGAVYRNSPNVWVPGNFAATSAQSNFMANAVATSFELFDVSLTEGPSAPPFVVPDYADELLACQRYYWKNMPGVQYSSFGAGFMVSASQGSFHVMHPVSMRGNPTVLQSNTAIFSGAGIITAVSSLTGGYTAQMAALLQPSVASAPYLGGQGADWIANTTTAYVSANARL